MVYNWYWARQFNWVTPYAMFSVAVGSPASIRCSTWTYVGSILHHFKCWQTIVLFCIVVLWFCSITSRMTLFPYMSRPLEIRASCRAGTWRGSSLHGFRARSESTNPTIASWAKRCICMNGFSSSSKRTSGLSSTWRMTLNNFPSHTTSGWQTRYTNMYITCTTSLDEIMTSRFWYRAMNLGSLYVCLERRRRRRRSDAYVCQRQNGF